MVRWLILGLEQEICTINPEQPMIPEHIRVFREKQTTKKKKWQEYVKGTQNLLKELPMSKPGLI